MNPRLHFCLLLIIALMGAIALVVGRRRVRGTTLMAAWWWALVALVAVVGVEIAASLSAVVRGASWLHTARYLAWGTTICAPMAVLGAKRPQHHAWQFIVLTLYVVVALPAFESLLFGYGEVSLHSARRWFLLVLIAIGALNYLPTRYWPSSVFYAAGEAVLFAGVFEIALPLNVEMRTLLALALLAGACVVPMVWILRRRTTRGIDRLWIDFRDAFGALWALRIQERVNATGGGKSLDWSGFSAVREPRDATNDGQREAAQAAFLALLARFVSDEWIAARSDVRDKA